MGKTKKFKVDLSELSESERKVVKILKKVGEVIQSMWELQYNEETERCTCYPKGVSKKEIQKAAEKNPDILNPYTIIKQDKQGNLYAENYTQACPDKFDKLTSLLHQASNTTEDPELKKYLNKLEKDYNEGNFEQALIDFVEKPKTKIDILIGPISSYPDKLFGVKKTFQLNLRILLEEDTKELQEIINIVKKLGIVKPLYSAIHKIKEKKVRASVYDVIMFAGRQASSHPSATNLPDENDLVEKHGTKIIFYKNSMLEKNKKIITKYGNLVEGVTQDYKKYYDAYFKLVAYHEITEAVIKYPNTITRLKSNYDAMRELHAFMTGMRSASIHVLTGFINKEIYSQMLQMMMLYGLNAIDKREKDTSILEYAKGFAVIFNYALEANALEIKNNKLHFDYDKVHKLTFLTDSILKIMAEGTYDDAQRLFDKYCDYSKVDKLLQ